MTQAIDALIEKIRETGCPVCVGLDPVIEYLPPGLPDFITFNKGLIDALEGLVPCVKPQIAMYERYGIPGITAYTETIAYAKSKGFTVIGDIKRGDIASTAAAYAEGHLGGGSRADFVTVNPFLGRDSVEPFIEVCRKNGKGIFVLVKTSNPGSADIQDLDVGGEKLYERVGSMVADWGAGLMGKYGYSSVGAVVGATWPEQAAALRKRMPHTFFLIPGYGAQGGKAEDIARCFDKDGLGGVVNSSRGIIAAWKKPEYAGADYRDAAREETLKMKADLGRFIHVR
ncbi:MAG: orotidine-5'-phosphate decarboxylase [Clostridiales bacterium]|jgi:orotidine-5'-phosphate decarboxylase|nr:orotidine-5'-phosphate decarboxylase [Clostridiales bacterium]